MDQDAADKTHVDIWIFTYFVECPWCSLDRKVSLALFSKIILVVPQKRTKKIEKIDI